jgi:hypothetical protein
MVVLGKSRATSVGTLATTNSGDGLGYISFEGVNSATTPAQAVGVSIEASQVATATSTGLASDLVIKTSNGTTLSEVVRVTSSKNLVATNTYVSSGNNYNLKLVSGIVDEGYYYGPYVGCNLYYSSSGSYNPTKTYASMIAQSSAGVVFYVDSSLTAGTAFTPTSRVTIDTTGIKISTGYISKSRGATVASASTIAPTGSIFHVSGTAAIATITAPYSGFNGMITIIPDGAFTTTTSGNIALGTTAVVGKALIMTYDSTTSKWYPSY